MAEKSWPSPDDGRVVTERQFEIMSSQVTDNGLLADDSGVYIDIGGVDPVYGDSSGMQVKIPAGVYGVVRGFGWESGSTIVTKPIDSNSSGLTRTDRVVLELNKTTWNVRLAIVKGTPGGGLPSLARSTGNTGLYQVHLATVTVGSGVLTITSVAVVANGDHIGSKVRAHRKQADAEIPRMGEVWFDEETRTWSGWDGSVVRVISNQSYSWDPNGNVKLDTGTTTSTTFTENVDGAEPQCTVNFFAGPEGHVNIRVYAGMWSSAGGGKAALLGARVYEYPVVAGPVWDASDHDAAATYSVYYSTNASEMIVSGLTPGQEYQVRLTYKADSGTVGTFHRRKVFVNPW